jgi:hypothetical protein
MVPYWPERQRRVTFLVYVSIPTSRTGSTFDEDEEATPEWWAQVLRASFTNYKALRSLLEPIYYVLHIGGLTKNEPKKPNIDMG